MKNLINNIKELKKKSYGKPVLFFGGYLIFFIILFILIGVTGKSPVTNNNSYSINPVSIESILNKNYTFSYKVVLDDNTYLYEGDKLNDEISFKYNNKEYYQNSSNTYIKEEDWVSVDNPIKFKYIFNEENLNNIVENSYYESKTTYESGKVIYNYLISSNTINRIINGNETDFSEEPNKLSIVKSSDVEEISLNLDSYCVLNKLCNKSLKIIVNYDNYNSVKQVVNPIEK